MKFVCMECDRVMEFGERELPGDGTMSAVFDCPSCGREIALLTNPMETRLVSSMGVKVGGRGVPEQPMELVRSNLEEARDDAFEGDSESGHAAGSAGDFPSVGPSGPATEGDEGPRSEQAAASRPSPADGSAGAIGGRAPVQWSPEALERLERVPRFVRGMVKRIYTEYAQERGITEFTPALMDRARTDLGLEGM